MDASREAGPVEIHLIGCARCDGDHEKLSFRPLLKPVDEAFLPRPFTHWAKCPTLGEPILLRLSLIEETKTVIHNYRAADDV